MTKPRDNILLAIVIIIGAGLLATYLTGIFQIVADALSLWGWVYLIVAIVQAIKQRKVKPTTEIKQ